MAKKIPLFYDSRCTHLANKDKVCYPHPVHEFEEIFTTTDINRSLPGSEKFYFLLDSDFLIAFWDIAYHSKTHVPADLWNRAWGFSNRIPVDIIARVKNKQAKFLLYDSDWSMHHVEDDFVRFIEIMAHSLGVVYSDFVFTSNIYQARHSKLQLVSYNFWETRYVSRFMQTYPDIGQELVKVINNKRVKNNKFICLINRKSVTRMLTAILLWDLRHEGVLTFSKEPGGINDPRQDYQDIFKALEPLSPTLVTRFQQEIEPNLPLEWYVDQQVASDGLNPREKYDKLLVWSDHPHYITGYQDCYLNVITETQFLANFPLQLSEKTFKPIMYMMPFVLIGQPGSLALLHKLGYKTFDRWIDESYDLIEDDLLRTYAATESIKRFIKMPPQELSDTLVDMLPVLLHNKRMAEFRCQNQCHLMTIELLGYLNQEQQC